MGLSVPGVPSPHRLGPSPCPPTLPPGIKGLCSQLPDQAFSLGLNSPHFSLPGRDLTLCQLDGNYQGPGALR